ncbi:MAG: MerR family transcriptional regulator [Bacteroidales bacterium]|nr:MerR family transcriptional regulator [Bacteroidales bacterium]
MANYTIKDLEKLSGIKAHTIRIWEKRYGLIEPERTSTNIRTYCDAELKKLLNISILNKNGFKISKIANLTNDEITTNISRLTENLTDTETQIENLAIAMIDLDENKFERILSRTIIQLGFEDTVIKVLNPFFMRIGIMWQTGTINPAQEHFVSNLIRQKMLVAIDSQLSSESPNTKNFLLFLPEGEMHELGLLFASYLIRKRGHRVIYLGQNVPFNDLIEVDKIRSCHYLYLSFIVTLSDEEALNYLERLSKIFPDKSIYITGQNKLRDLCSGFTNIKFIGSPKILISELNYIDSL